MPTDVSRLKNAINSALDDYDNIDPADRNTARLDFANKLAAAIITEIKAASIIYTSGLTAGPYPVTGVFNHSIT